MKKLDTPIQVTKSFLPPFNEYTKEIERIWSSHWLTNNGSIHRDFENEVKNYLSVEQVSLLVNGHLALETAIKTLNLSGEIITTPFTFASTAHAISNSGLTPVFCDISPLNCNIDATKIESLITKRTSAIMPVHVFGNPCDIEAIEHIATKYNIKVIYDAAHAFGVKVNGRGIGSFGDLSMFSLHATKVFNSIEGGVLTYQDQRTKEGIELYKNFGISGPETVELVGTNAKMNEFQAAMGLVNLRYIDSEIQKRKELVNHYRKRLDSVKGISYIQEQNGIEYNYAYFPIFINMEESGVSRDILHEKLKEYNIMTRKYFYPLCTDFKCYKDFDDSHLINARVIANQVLTLPIYSELSIETLDFICDAIEEIQNKSEHY